MYERISLALTTFASIEAAEHGGLMQYLVRRVVELSSVMRRLNGPPTGHAAGEGLCQWPPRQAHRRLESGVGRRGVSAERSDRAAERLTELVQASCVLAAQYPTTRPAAKGARLAR